MAELMEAMVPTAAVATVAAATEVAEGEATVAVTARWVTIADQSPIGLKMMNFSPTAAKQRRCAPLPSPLASTCRRPA